MNRLLKCLLLLPLTLLWVSTAVAQEPETTPPEPILFLTDSRTESPPAVDLRLFGYTPQGDSLAISPDTVNITHSATAIAETTVLGSESVGTFTLFLIDIPPGVADQFETIAADIRNYASAATMQEQLDSVAIYQVGEDAASEILPPTEFHNAVQNVFASPLEPAQGATALVDSINSLLDEMDNIKPDPAMAASIVVFSDGTDVVSSTDLDTIGPRAAELGVPLHTIWLENANLPPVGQELGRDYLEALAIQSRGRATTIADDTAVANLWSHIAAFRNQTILRYTVPDISGGRFDVTVSLADNPDVSAQTSVALPTNLPTVSLDVPADSRSLSLPALDDPVNLRFSATAGWLDGETREITAVTLLSNGDPVAEIQPDNLNDFTVELNNLVYGENNIAVVILDAQGLRATSPAVTLTVNEGPRDIPEALAAGGGFGRFITVLGLLLVAVAGLIIGLIILARQGWLQPIADWLPRGPREPRVMISGADDPGATAEPAAGSDLGRTVALLEVLATESAVAPRLPLRRSVVRLGRSPNQADIAFDSDLTVSRLHASLRLEGQHYRIFDEGSSSGTWVNDQQVPGYGIQLMPGDEIHLGAVHLRYWQDDE